jgi:hypothetical protein
MSPASASSEAMIARGDSPGVGVHYGAPALAQHSKVDLPGVSADCNGHYDGSTPMTLSMSAAFTM